jgi:hypothetical protein
MSNILLIRKSLPVLYQNLFIAMTAVPPLTDESHRSMPNRRGNQVNQLQLHNETNFTMCPPPLLLSRGGDSCSNQQKQMQQPLLSTAADVG